MRKIVESLGLVLVGSFADVMVEHLNYFTYYNKFIQVNDLEKMDDF